MAASRTTQIAATENVTVPVTLDDFLPDELRSLSNPQTDLPRIAKDEKLIHLIEGSLQQVPTTHALVRGDARTMANLQAESVHLVLTSPPYWTLKEYREHRGQLGHLEDYEEF